MRKYLILVLIAIFFFYMGFVMGESNVFSIQKQPQPTMQNLDEKKLFDLVQRWRYENNLHPYINSNKVCSIAKKRLEEVKANWSHSGFEGSRFCTSYCKLGENLAKDGTNEEETLTAWLDSASHAATLKEDFRYSCLKCEGSLCVQIFANI